MNIHIYVATIFTVDVPAYCHAHPRAIVPDEKNCAKFYNCSDGGGSHRECQYPDLFSRSTRSCDTFVNVSCDSRLEPQAPCKMQFTQIFCLHI